MYRCESWTIKKAEWWRIDAFKLWCWRRLLWVPWTARRSNQWILKEINPEFSLEGLMLKLQYFGHLIRREGQRSNVWCSPWGHKELDSAEWLNNNNFLIQFTTAIVQLWTNINAGKSEKKRTLLHCQWKGKLVTATMENGVQVFKEMIMRMQLEYSLMHIQK